MVQYWQCRCKTCGIVGSGETIPHVCPKCEQRVEVIGENDYFYALRWTRVGCITPELIKNIRGNKVCPCIGLQNVCRAKSDFGQCFESRPCDYPEKVCSWKAKPAGVKLV